VHIERGLRPRTATVQVFVRRSSELIRSGVH
jgi:hypothetical protein